MSFNSIQAFVYELNNNNIKIWVEEHELKVFVPHDKHLNQGQKDFIRLHKKALLKYLQDRGIFSRQSQYLITHSGLDKQVLSFAQERLWFTEKYQGGATNVYNIPMVFKLDKVIKLDVLESSIRSIVLRHEVLRTRIVEDSIGNSYQVVEEYKETSLKITRTVLPANQNKLHQKLKDDAGYVFDLTKEFPIKVALYITSSNNYLSIIAHHIAFDGYSVDIFIKELEEYYRYYLDKLNNIESKLNLPVLSIQYKDFALWQRQYLSEEILYQQLQYWKSRLDGYEVLNLITDRPRPFQINYHGKDINFEIDSVLSSGLREMAKNHKVSLYTVMLAAFYLMLRAHSNQDDIVVGTPVANRHYPQIEHLIGFFVNFLALRCQINPQTAVRELIKYVGDAVIEAQSNQDFPFEKIVEELGYSQDLSRHPIFQVMFSVQSFGSTQKSSLLQHYELDTNLYDIARFDLSVSINDSGKTLKGSFNYATTLYDEVTVVNFISTYVTILEQFVQLNTVEKINGSPSVKTQVF